MPAPWRRCCKHRQITDDHRPGTGCGVWRSRRPGVCLRHGHRVGRSRFCLSEARLGLAPAAIGPYVVRVLGERQSRRYFLTSEEISASGAEAFGLVHDVTSRESLDGVIDILIQRLLGNGPTALTACKELIARCGQSAPDQALVEYTANLIADLRTGTEGQEGLKAFLEKRKASWVQE